jgi:hypothetical protein
MAFGILKARPNKWLKRIGRKAGLPLSFPLGVMETMSSTAIAITLLLTA